METSEIVMSPEDFVAVPGYSSSVGGFSDMASFAVDRSGRTVVAAGALGTAGVVVMDVERSVARLRRNVRMLTDQSPLLALSSNEWREHEEILVPGTKTRFRLPADRDARSIYRLSGGRLVRARVRGDDTSAIDFYMPDQLAPAWSVDYPTRILAVAIAPDASQVALALGGERVQELRVLQSASGKEAWRASLKLDRGTGSNADPLFFSPDGTQVILRGASEVEFRAASDGRMIRRVDVGTYANDGFDETVHAGFDGRYLWFFQYRAPRDRSHMVVFASPSRGPGRRDLCAYTVFDTKRGRLVREATTAKDIEELLLGTHRGGGPCNVRAVLPLRDGGVLVVEYVSSDTIRIHRSKSVPGT